MNIESLTTYIRWETRKRREEHMINILNWIWSGEPSQKMMDFLDGLPRIPHHLRGMGYISHKQIIFNFVENSRHYWMSNYDKKELEKELEKYL